MQFNLSVDRGGIEIFQSLPEDLLAYRIAGSDAIAVRTEFADCLFHQFKGTDFTATFSRFLPFNDGVFEARSEAPVLEFRAALSGELVGDWDGIRYPGLRPSTFNVSSTPHVATRAQFRRDRHCTTFDIHFKRAFFERFRSSHRALALFLEQVDAGQPIELSPYAHPIPRMMRQAIGHIIDNPFTLELQPFALEAQVQLIITSALERTLTTTSRRSLVLQPHQIDALYYVKQLIDADVMEPPSIDALCRKVKISEEVLLVGFRQLFDTTPYDYYMDTRFKKVEEWLLSGAHSVSGISQLAGYQHVQSFSKEFHKRYHCSPLQFRRANGRK